MDGLMGVMGIDDVMAEEDRLQDEDDLQNQPFISGLVAYGLTCWEAAKSCKWIVEDRLFASLRQRKGEYDADELAAIQNFGGTDIYMLLTSMKCRAAKSWITDIQLPAGEKPWAIDPTPVPELPGNKEEKIAEVVQNELVMLMSQVPDMQITADMVTERVNYYREQILIQEKIKSKHIALQQETYLNDILSQGGFYDAMRHFIDDFTTYPTAFLKGPIVYATPELAWDGEVPVVRERSRRYWERVSPFDIYPAPASRDLNDGPLIERLRLRRKDLNNFMGVEGFDEEAIRGVLEKFGRGGVTSWLWTDQERADLASRPDEDRDPEALIDCLSIWCDVQGSELLEWGMDESLIPDKDIDYAINMYLIDNYVIMARLNPDPLGQRPYFCASYDPHSESIWGQNSLPETMTDCQKMCNAAARACANNMTIASGPQVDIDVDRVDPGEDVENIYPWRVWRTKSTPVGGGMPTSRAPVNFYQPNMVAEPLLAIYQYFYDQASEQSGIPNYVHGSEKVSGAGRTARGLSMLMNAAGKTLKDTIGHIDVNVIKPAIKMLWVNVMLNDEGVPKTGDIDVLARASDSLIISEQLDMLRQEFLNYTGNPIDMQIIGVNGRAAILRELAKNLKMPEGEIVPDRAQLENNMMNQPPVPVEAAPPTKEKGVV